MKYKYHLSIIVFFICFSLAAQTSLYVGDDAQVTINGATVSANGNILTEGKIIGDTQSILFLNGKDFQYVGDTLSDSIRLGSIYQTNRPGVCYNSNVHLIGDTGYWFRGGAAFINNRDMWFLGNSTWVDNNNSLKFFVNKGLGLIYKPNSGPGITYPVGFDSVPSAYAPIILENFGVADNFGVRVQKGIDFHYNQPFGTPDSAPILDHAVNNTWIINEQVKGGTRLLYTPIWQASHELPGFFRPESIVAWYSEIDHTWHWEDNQPAIGSDPFSARKIDTLFANQGPLSFFDYMPVSVGDPVSPLPLEQIILKSAWNGDYPSLDMSYIFEESAGQLGLYRSTDGSNFSIIDSFYPASIKGFSKYLDVNFKKVKVNGFAYYQVRTMNRNKQVSSNTSSLYYSKNQLASIFPNPTIGDINLFFPTTETIEGSINIYAVNGALVAQQNVNFNENKNITTLNTKALAAGVYQVVFRYNNQYQVFRFIKNL